ncbi:MAG TPA: hypothetical protein VND92_02450 [Vicinamibacterales bacterium]|nr:hypothetical protein [Vicinamibacterales bacterium]
MSGTFWKLAAGVRVVETRVDDTLQAIAARELGDAARWPDIANLNNLLPPYITPDLALAGPRVAFAGQPIKVPSAPPAASGVADPNAVFGTDIALVNGQITDDGSGDLLTVSGPANLAQAITGRLVTRPGELLFHPAYGCAVYGLLGGGATAAAVQLAASFVARAVRSDPRVSAVENATAVVQGDALVTSAVAVTVDGKRQAVGASSGLSG